MRAGKRDLSRDECIITTTRLPSNLPSTASLSSTVNISARFAFVRYLIQRSCSRRAAFPPLQRVRRVVELSENSRALFAPLAPSPLHVKTYYIYMPETPSRRTSHSKRIHRAIGGWKVYHIVLYFRDNSSVLSYSRLETIKE